MNEVDWVILAVLFFSTILGVSRGVVREILAIVGWVLGIFLSLRFAPELAELIPLPSVSILIRTAFAAVGKSRYASAGDIDSKLLRARRFCKIIGIVLMSAKNSTERKTVICVKSRDKFTPCKEECK